MLRLIVPSSVWVAVRGLFYWLGRIGKFVVIYPVLCYRILVGMVALHAGLSVKKLGLTVVSFYRLPSCYSP